MSDPLSGLDPLAGLLATLDLTDTGARTSEDIFTGPSQWTPGGRVFGGQVYAQSIIAAIRTLPEELPTPAEVLGPIDHPVAQFWATSRAFDIRHVEQPIYFRADPHHVPRQAIWMKTIGPLPDDDTLHRAALAYASDYSILEPILRAHG